jgi:Leucine rich repeat
MHRVFCCAAFALSAIGLIIGVGGVRADEPEKPLVHKPLPADVIKAWDRAEFVAGWMSDDKFAFHGTFGFGEGGKGRPGVVPAFTLSEDWEGQTVVVLPAPPVPFGLSLRHNRGVTESLKGLRGLDNLWALDLHGTKAANMRDVAKLEQLRVLNLRYTRVDDGGVRQLAGLKKLRALSLEGLHGLTDAGLAELSGLTELRSLDLSNATALTDLKPLAKMKHLQSLAAHGSPVTDAGLGGLADLTALRELDLSSTKVTGAGLKALAGLKELEALNLSNTAVTDEGVKELAGLIRLKSLNLSNTKVTATRVDALKMALPKCKVEH